MGIVLLWATGVHAYIAIFVRIDGHDISLLINTIVLFFIC